MERLRAREWLVEPVDREVARILVAVGHYAQDGANTGTAFHGLFRRDDHMTCLGVAWWLPPTRAAAASVWPADPAAVLALSRFVVMPEVPANGASFLLAGATRLIAQAPPHESRTGLVKHWRCLLTYADTRLGHTGGIYRAAGWEYLGLTRPEAAWTDAAGRQVSRKRGPRTLTVAEMAELGYTRVGSYAKHKYRKVLW